MTKDTFLKIVISAIKNKGVSVPGSKEAKLNGLGRQFESRSIGISEVMDGIRSVFADNYEIDRHVYSEIEESLKRY